MSKSRNGAGVKGADNQRTRSSTARVVLNTEEEEDRLRAKCLESKKKREERIDDPESEEEKDMPEEWRRELLSDMRQMMGEMMQEVRGVNVGDEIDPEDVLINAESVVEAIKRVEESGRSNI